MTYCVAALYHFTRLSDYQHLKPPLQDMCDLLDIKGTLLLAREGINGTIAGTDSAISDLLDFLRADFRLKHLEHKESRATTLPFYRMKVRLKKEIVTMGVDGVDPNEIVGTYVDPKDWNNKPKVAMFCTGGIRCEKASSYMKQNGFEDVYHLKGGILKYLETQTRDNSMWEGDCFVFDQRVAVSHH